MIQRTSEAEGDTVKLKQKVIQQSSEAEGDTMKQKVIQQKQKVITWSSWTIIVKKMLKV